jgi:hypothetical protein
MRMVLSAWAVLRSYKEDNWGNQSQFCMEIWRKVSVDSQAVKRSLGGWCEMAASQL